MLEDPAERGACSDVDTDMASASTSGVSNSGSSESGSEAGDAEMAEARPYPWVQRSMHTGNLPEHSGRQLQRMLRAVRARRRLHASGLGKVGLGYTPDGPARADGPIMFQREASAAAQHTQSDAAGPSSASARPTNPPTPGRTPTATQHDRSRQHTRRTGAQPAAPTTPPSPAPTPTAAPAADSEWPPLSSGRPPKPQRASTKQPHHARTLSILSWFKECTDQVSARSQNQIIGDLRVAHPEFWEGGHLEPHSLPPDIVAFLNAAYDGVLGSGVPQRTCRSARARHGGT